MNPDRPRGRRSPHRPTPWSKVHGRHSPGVPHTADPESKEGNRSMSRINTNIQSLIAQRVLGQNTKSLNQSLERLSTGYKINRGKDDPAGLIASENLRS